MKSLFAFVLPVFLTALCAVPAAAQFGGSGALGGSFASRGMSRPLGGIQPGFTGLGPNRNSPNRGFGGGQRRRTYGYPYAYSVWVPDYFDYLDAQNQYAAQYAPYAPAAPPAPAQPQQPVIINNYYGVPAPGGQAPEETSPPPANTNNAQAPGDPIGPPQNYYLIAYKNHAIYAALAYWLEDNTLHYVTTQNTHNQASLDLIDITLSKSLNQGRDVPFTIAGK